MDYNLKWSTVNPGHLVWLVDLSYSMSTNNKIGKVMTALQSSLREIIAGNAVGRNNFAPRFTTTIIGYNTDIVPLFPSSHLTFGSIDDAAELIKKANTSHEPIFNYNKGGIAEPNWMTYMTKAFNAARENIEKWIAESKGKQLPAPIVINITDGQPEEAKKTLEVCAKEALEAAQRLKNVRTPHGNVLLWNLHIGDSGNLNELLFPNTPPNPTGNAREDLRLKFLYESSSIMPEIIISRAPKDIPLQKGSHGMVSNIKEEALLARLIAFGSTSTGMMGTEPEKPE